MIPAGYWVKGIPSLLLSDALNKAPNTSPTQVFSGINTMFSLAIFQAVLFTIIIEKFTTTG